MVFYKTFPKETEKSMYPKWIEVMLTNDEEKEQEELARRENTEAMKQCIEDAQSVMREKNLKPFQTDMINMAIALFEKRASHSVYYKENKARDKFDKITTK